MSTRGKQELYLRQKPVEFNRLIEIAKIQSTESSKRIEGIITTNARLKQLAADKTTPKNRAVVKAYVSERVGKFSKQEVLAGCPSLGSSSVKLALKKLVEDGTIVRIGAGRKTLYAQVD